MKDNWWLWGGIALAAYFIYQNSLTSSVVGSVTGYMPVTNVSGNEFSCPPGTNYVDSGEQASGGGVCV